MKNKKVLIPLISLVLIAGIVLGVILLPRVIGTGTAGSDGSGQGDGAPGFIVWHSYAPESAEAKYLDVTLLAPWYG